jgi:hypothetical protein
VTILLRTLARNELARGFYRDIANENDFFYLFVGKTTEWPVVGTPETPLDTESYNGQTHRNMMFVKRVQSSDAVMMIRRIDWVAGTVYDHYDDVEDLSNKDFYVLTDDMRVYKCLNNNNNARSFHKPNSTDTTNAFTLPDGYVWKYMFKVEASDQLKFLTPDYIPVRKMAGVGVPLFDINGFIDSITVDAGGENYDPNNLPLVLVQGDGVGATAEAVVDPDTNVITDITVTNEGYGYTFARIVIVDNGTGTGAAATANLGNIPVSVVQEYIEAAAVPGTVDRITLTSGGVNYSSGDVLVTITGDGTGAEAVAYVNELGLIDRVDVTNPGSGYTFAEVSFNNILGFGEGATATATISPYYGHGANPVKELYAKTVCISVNLTNDTSDYFYNNDYRQLGIVKNVLNPSFVNFADDTGTTCYVIEVSDTSKYSNDDEITTNGGGKFIVAQVKTETNKVYLLPVIPVITSSSTLTNTTKSITGLTINSLTAPDVVNTTGEILYIENRLPINRQLDQIEKIRTIINF